MSLYESVAFTAAAAALLGSPGPGIAALVAVGRTFRKRAALRFFLAMQVGLAIAAGLSAAGLSGLFRAAPAIETIAMILATLYLLWLAWSVATAPVGRDALGTGDETTLSIRAAFMLGVANPKAYLAFASLFGSFELVRQAPLGDGLAKWSLVVVTMAVVDLAWLILGMAMGRIAIPVRHERNFNLVMGLTILAACVATWL